MGYKSDSKNSRRRWVGPVERYDILKEGTIIFVILALAVVLLSFVFGAPKVPGVTFKMWANNAPVDFATTTLTELNKTSETATYGPPYNNQTGQIQTLPAPFEWFAPQSWTSVSLPVDAQKDLVLNPLTSWSALSPSIASTMATWNNATATQRDTWLANSAKSKVNVAVNDGVVSVTGVGDVGPIPEMLTAMLTGAKAGALDSQLMDSSKSFSMDYTKALLYIEDGNYIGDIANKYNLNGSQWGMMNEIGSWPGQPWLWIYTVFYQIPPWSNWGMDLSVMVTVIPLFILLFFLPFIPVLRDIPRWIGIYRLIWRNYYRRYHKK